jgi:hypothetical protein
VKVIGLLLVLAGFAFGLYAGVWWAFIGGIVDIINEVRAHELSALNVAIGVAKIFFAGLIGWFAAMLLIVPGLAFLDV